MKKDERGQKSKPELIKSDSDSGSKGPTGADVGRRRRLLPVRHRSPSRTRRGRVGVARKRPRPAGTNQVVFIFSSGSTGTKTRLKHPAALSSLQGLVLFFNTFGFQGLICSSPDFLFFPVLTLKILISRVRMIDYSSPLFYYFVVKFALRSQTLAARGQNDS